MSHMSLAKQKPLVTIDDFLDTYPNPKEHHAQKAKRFLEEKGVVPLTFTNKHFLDLNILVGWLYWSGSIRRHANLYKASVSVEGKYIEGLEEPAKRLDIKLKPDLGREGMFFSHNGARYARLISKLGVYLSEGKKKKHDTKTNHPIELPDYVKFLITHYTNLRGGDKRIAAKCLADQCKILLFTRLKSHRGYHTLNLLANKEQQNVERLTAQVLQMFNTIYPKIGLNEESLSPGYYDKDRGNYYISIRFSSEKMMNAMRYYGLFKFQQNIAYHPHNKILSAKL